MKHLNLLYVALLVGPLVAQEEARRDTRPAAPPGQQDFRVQDQVALSDVLGAKVRLKPKAGERAEAAGEGRVAKGPNGSVDDLVIDCHNGQATWAILSVGGLLGIGDKEVAVPVSSLVPVRLDNNKVMYDLDATDAELKSLPVFDKKAVDKTGLDVTMQNCETSWKKVRPDARMPAAASGNGNGHRPADASAVAPTSAVLGSKLKGMNLRCSEGKEPKTCGEIETVVFDVNSHTVTYLVIGKGGVLGIGETNYLIPYGATRIITVDQKPVLTVAKSSSELESATRYTKPDSGCLGDENARASSQYWGVEHGKRLKGDVR
jgi:sporulation protein YlmC with PRC-barrel domain